MVSSSSIAISILPDAGVLPFHGQRMWSAGATSSFTPTLARTSHAIFRDGVTGEGQDWVDGQIKAGGAPTSAIRPPISH
ncbi:MAG TPA: hypothetical protein VFW76_00810 [Ktedonobacterales bacterium]|nr:hypothetical protein [Ktedonobacterales bacterium]